MPFFYDCVFLLYAVVYLPYLLLTRRGYEGFAMRFGIFSPELRNRLKAGPHVWLHAVSVGEVMVLKNFMESLSKAQPGCRMVVTVTTKTGYALARQLLKDAAVVLPSPLDLSWVVRRFVQDISPRAYIAVETEIWPNLFACLFSRQIPVSVINGRISDKSWPRYKAAGFLLKDIFHKVALWCMQSRIDADRVVELGADASRVFVCGNLKFDDGAAAAELSSPAVGNGLCWVAGSTHPGEEEIILDVYAKLIQDDQRWQLIIAPRHVERAGHVRTLVSSRGLNATVIDTIGQLRSLYAKAALVFVGKTLCVGGGQNVIEPAGLGKAIVIGPHVENFRDVVACFREKKAIIQVNDAVEFERTVRDLCADADQREKLGTAARRVVLDNRGAIGRTLEHMKPLLEPGLPTKAFGNDMLGKGNDIGRRTEIASSPPEFTPESLNRGAAPRNGTEG